METKCPWVEVYRSASKADEMYPFKVILAPGPHGVCIGAFARPNEAEGLATQVRAAVVSKHAAIMANSSPATITAKIGGIRESFEEFDAEVKAQMDDMRRRGR
jgi:hypothetical protein